MKKIIALVLALALVLASCAVAFADAPTGTIRITNAARGIKYNIYKLLDLTVDGDAIAYTYGTDGVLPEGLATYFPKVDKTVNNVDASAAAKSSADANQLSDEAIEAIEEWLKTATKAATEQEGNGTAVEFKNLPYGYYVITSTQGDKPKITVATLASSEKSVVDKNTTEPDIDKYVATGTTEGEDGTTITWGESVDAKIGAPVQYKIEALTSNWHAPAAGGDQKQVKDYVIRDNLAGGKLTLVSIDSIKVGSTTVTLDPAPTAFPITIPWVKNVGTADAPVWESLYNNGAKIEIIYTAKLNDGATIDTVEANGNRANLDWDYVDNTPHWGDGEDHLYDDAKTETYGIAFVKVNKEGEKLAGAEFSLPFKAHKLQGSTLNEWVYEPGEGTTTVTTTADGAIIVRGLDAGEYVITETKAPAGYNQLAEPVKIQAQLISTSSTVTRTDKYWKYDENGKKFDEVESSSSVTTEWHNDQIAVTAVPVLNLTGTVLPSTGGIGTTIFYVVGGLLVLGAVVMLITKKRMSKEG